jgi:hypothetical protein
MSQYCLIENINSISVLPGMHIYVALTQKAIYQLDKNNIKYITFEDFYTSGQIRGNTDKYMQEQLVWFDKLDQLLFKIYPYAKKNNLSLASIYYYWLKYLLDNIILSSAIINIFIKDTNPKRIVFISKFYESDKIDNMLSFKNSESTYSRLIEPICKKHHIPFDRIFIDVPFIRNSINLKDVIKKTFPDVSNLLKYIKEYIIIHKSLLSFNILARNSRSNILLLLRTKEIVQAVKDIGNNEGISYHLFSSGKIHKGNFFFKQTECIFKNTTSLNDSLNKLEVDTNSRDQIYKWINKKCDLDVTDILRTRLDFFIDNLCDGIISLTPVFADYYKYNNIDYVITDRIFDLHEHAAILAKDININTKSVYFCHGSDALERKSRYFMVYRFYDYMFSPTQIEANHENDVKNEFHKLKPKVFHVNYLSNLYKQKYKQRKIFNNRSKEIVLFIPIMATLYPNRPVEKGQPFPMEYVKWHKALVNYFTTINNFDFIWKGFPMPDQNFDLIRNIIVDSKILNIQFRSNNLEHWMKKADRVICDSPSTAFFQAISSGLPVMSLYRPKDQIIQSKAEKVYGASLSPYSNVEEGLKHIEKFLDGSPSSYIVDLPPSKIFISDVLLGNTSNL